MNFLENILTQLAGISKAQKKFFLTLMTTILLVYGKVNFTNLSRYSQLNEKTYRRHFQRSFNFLELNKQLLQLALAVTSRKILAMDCSFIQKSGKKTYGKDYFYNSSKSQAERGLEISLLALIDLDINTAYALSVQQTSPSLPTESPRKTTKKSPGKNQKKSRKSSPKTSDNQEDEATRVDQYLEQLKRAQSYIPSDIRHLVADGYYSKKKFVDGVISVNFHYLGKLRIDANMRYLYQGEQKERGRPRLYAGKVNFTNLSRLTWCQEVEKSVNIYSAIVNHVSLERNIKIVVVVDQRQPDKTGYLILFSTDLSLTALEIYEYYQARFQIEFIFRDAKQFTGLVDCQARDAAKLDFHFNASLTALNIAKLSARLNHQEDEPFIFSMATYKRQAFNAHLLEQFILKLDLEPTLIKSHPNYSELLSYGAIAV